MEKNKLTSEELEKYKHLSNHINLCFKEYYKSLLFNMNSKELEEFYELCTKVLPITFRINKIK
jgi:hypothetical protein